jgi:cytochrome c oxidase subunit 3
MWTFLATEVLLFGGLFLAYTLYRMSYPDVFADGGRTMEFWLGTLNTAVLLTGSLFMAVADHAVRTDRIPLLRKCLAATVALGIVFLVIKGFEYDAKFTGHLVPGRGFRPVGPAGQREQIFFFLYFAMTGLHALHMVGGVAAVSWLWILCARGRLSRRRPDPVAIVGLYWHFVDCIWIFLYPLFYLAGR